MEDKDEEVEKERVGEEMRRIRSRRMRRGEQRSRRSRRIGDGGWRIEDRG